MGDGVGGFVGDGVGSCVGAGAGATDVPNVGAWVGWGPWQVVPQQEVWSSNRIEIS